MKLTHEIEETKGYFQYLEGEEIAAYLSYSRAGEDLIIIDHTDVKPSYKGQGLGKKLVYEAVDYARKNKIKIMPICPYATSVFQKEEGIRDVLRN
ncbi:MAG: GNAT family N-acetyltransferase [Vicingaceae bacterium]